jgi:hypothetical protein
MSAIPIGTTVRSRATGIVGVVMADAINGTLPLHRVQFGGSWQFWAHPTDLVPVQQPERGVLVLLNGGRADA